MIKLFLFLGISLLISIPGYACSINPDKIPFCNYASKGNTLIATGKIVQKIDYGIIIELYEVYRGEETRCKIKVFERLDEDCNGTIFKYPVKTMGKVGQVILFKAAQIVRVLAPENTWAEVGEYYNMYADISGFGQLMAPLVKKGNKFKGLFSEGVKSVKADQIMEELNACEVENLLPQVRTLCGEHPLSIYPNPAKEQVFIDQLVEDYEEILLYDLNGKVVYTANSYDSATGIPTSTFAAGLYFVVVKSDRGTFRQKLLISR